MISLLACTLAGALTRRIAGGLIPMPGGTLVSRIMAGLLLGAVVILAFREVPLLVLAPIPFLFFLGMASGFPPGGMVPKSFEQAGGISQQHGWALVGPMALWAAAWGLVWWPLVLAAVIVGPIYWLATLWQPYFPLLGFNRDGLPDPPAWAEPWIGGAMGLGLGLALYL